MWIARYSLILLAFASLAHCYPQGRIVNGTLTSIDKFPFMVSLRQYGTHACGCSIIAPRWILTAAYCVYGNNDSELSIQFASTVTDVNGRNVAQVKRIIVHEKYSSVYITDDVALIELRAQLVYNYKTLEPVRLPAQNYEIPQVPAGVGGVLVGWGQNYTFVPAQPNLHEVQLKIYSDEECISRHNNETTVDNICGGVDEGWKGQCYGGSWVL